MALTSVRGVCNCHPHSVHSVLTPFSRWTWVSQYQNVSILYYIGAKDDGSGGDNWSYKTCKAPVRLSLPTNQHPVFYMPDAVPAAQPTLSKHIIHTVSKMDPMILQNNLTKTGRLSIILTKRIVIQLPGLWLKNLVWVENHLRGIHSNTAPLRTTAKCSRARLTFFFVRKHLTSLFTTVIAAKHSISLSCRLQDGSCW